MSVPFVAEVSSNHARDMDRALRFVEVARGLGMSAVKFQQFRITKLFAPEVLACSPEHAARADWELPEDFVPELATRTREAGLEFTSTPFYLDAIELLEPWVDWFKVSSYQLLWLDFLREVARTGKPIVLSTGMGELAEIERAVEALREGGCARPTLLHCVSSYPTPPSEANLAAIRTLRERFDVPVGWSDHTVDETVVARAVRVHGAALVELHLDLDGEGAEYGGGHCWLPAEVAWAMELARSTEPLPDVDPADGDGVVGPRPSEELERAWRSDPSDGLRPLVALRSEFGESAS